MAEPRRCPECGAELSADALDGLCPKCLMAAGLESHGEVAHSPRRSSEAPTTPHPSGFVPPEPAWLATHFPQLEIFELLGHGGMGAVYKARQPKLDRLVALKIIRPASSDDPSFAERFNREAKMLARLNHPAIVGVYDFGSVDISLREMGPLAEREGYTSPRAEREDDAELYYVLMEYVDGSNLRELMRAGELTPPEALAIVPQICEALQFAHDEGVVHRDIKPENILLDKRGRVKIADFGLAKLAAGSPEDFTLTATHQVMGTPRYMAPEQMEGSHAVDHRADIYSLGIVFYEMLTGEVPAGHFEPPSKKVEIDVRLDEVVLRAMAREPERRYQQASEVKSEVESISMTALPAAIPPRRASSPANEAPIEAARQAVQFPAIGLIVVGSLLTVLGLFAQIPLLVWQFRRGSGQLSVEGFIVVLPSVLVILGLPLAMLIGGLKMLRLTSRHWAIGAAVLALSPIPSAPLWFLSLPLGIWALVVLAKPEVKQGFIVLRQTAIDRTRHNPRQTGDLNSNRDSISTRPPSATSGNPSDPPAIADSGRLLHLMASFWMTPQPRYARWVGVPILILTGLWMLASFLLTITVPAANEAVHGGWLALGLVGIPIVFLVLTLIWAIRARRSDRRQQR